MDEKSKNLIIGLLLASIYVGVGYFGINLISLPPGNLTPIWFASGVGLIAFRLLGKRAFVWVTLASFIVNFPIFLLTTRYSLLLTCLLGALVAGTDAFQAYLAYRFSLWVEKRLGHRLFSQPVDLVWFLIAVSMLPALLTCWLLVFLAGFISGTLPTGSALVVQIGVITIGNSLGLFLVGPLAWTWREGKLPLRDHLLARVVLNSLPLLSLIASILWQPYLILLTFPLLLLTYAYPYLIDAVLSMLPVALVASLATIQHMGSLTGETPEQSFTYLELFLFSLTLTRYAVALIFNRPLVHPPVAAPGSEGRLGKSPDKPERFNRSWIFLFLVIAISLVTAGLWFYQDESRIIRQKSYNELKAIGDLKTSQLLAWRTDRASNIQITTQDPFFRSAILQWLENPQDTTLQENILKRMDDMRSMQDIDNVILVTPDGRILLSLDPRLTSLEDNTQELVNQVITAGNMVFGNLSRCPICPQVHLDIGSPILDAHDRPVAVLILRTDPQAYLYPLIQTWPLPSQSAETLLVRREGDEVIFLNTLRHREDLVLTLRIPITQTDLPAVRATLGESGEVIGKDYRGMPVLADIRQIPGSDWYMVTKIDLSEALAEARYHGQVILIFIGLSILVSGALVGLLFINRQGRLYQELFTAEYQRNIAREEIRATLYSIGDGVISTDVTGSITRMNPVAEQLTGWSEAEAIGKYLKDIFQILNEESRTEVENPVERVIQEGKVVGLANHTLLRSRDGSLRPISDSGAPIYEESGKISGVVLVFRDQTEERTAAQSLLDSEDRYYNLFNSTNDGISLNKIICDAAGKPSDYLILDVNQMYEKILGIKKTTAIGTLASQLYGSGEPPYLDIYSRVAETGEPSSFETFFQSLDKYFHISVFSPGQGQFATIFQDITARKRAEEALKEYSARLEGEVELRTRELNDAHEKLVRQEKLAVLGQLAGGVGHELRNPLGVISNAVYYLKLTQEDGREDVKEYLDIIETETRAAGKIITDLLDYASTRSQERQACNLPDLIQQVMAKYPPPETIKVITDFPGDLPEVYVDPRQLEQILVNLISNACQAMPDSGVLSLSLKSTSHNHKVRLLVKDSGEGIPPENLDKIFEPLFTTKTHGIGLGLAVVKKMVESNAGSIHVESQVNKGTTFTLDFPTSRRAS
jgi:two-component system cell cycle sensor histidine kinase/response regulator CckA